MKRALIALGVALATFAAYAQVSTPPNTMPRGTAALPGFYVLGDRDTGLYSPAANQLAITLGGVARQTFDGTGSMVLRSSGTAGNYTAANSALFIKNAAGTELLRLWGTDPNDANFNSNNLYLGNLAGAGQPTDNVSAGYGNVGLGFNALTAITTGDRNVALGYRALEDSTSGKWNVAGGGSALANNTTGDRNFGLGYLALSSNTTGSGNIAIGTRAGYTGTPANANVSGTDNVWIGEDAGPGTTSQLTNSIAIGYGATNSASNEAVLGNSSITSTILRGAVTLADNVTLTKSTNGGAFNLITNVNAGAAAYGQFIASNDGATGYAQFLALGTGYTTNNAYVQDGVVVESGAGMSGGMSILARTGGLRLYSGGASSLVATLNATTFNLASGVALQLNGTTQTFPKTFTAVYNPASLAAAAARCDDVTVTGITTTGGAVAANIGAVDPAVGCVVASVRASATNTVRVCWQNTFDTITACDVASSTWTFTQAQ